MSLEHHDRAIQSFWEQWALVGRDILKHGEEVRYGHSLLEVKYQDSVPTVIVLSKSTKRKYPTNDDTKIAIAKLLNEMESSRDTGSHTFTVTVADGQFSHVLLDEYGNTIIR